MTDLVLDTATITSKFPDFLTVKVTGLTDLGNENSIKLEISIADLVRTIYEIQNKNSAPFLFGVETGQVVSFEIELVVVNESGTLEVTNKTIIEKETPVGIDFQENVMTGTIETTAV